MAGGLPSWINGIVLGVVLLAIGGSILSSETSIQPLVTIGWVTIIGGIIIIGIIIRQAI